MSMTVPSTLSPGPVRAWILASRPPTLAAAVVPVAVGTAVAASAGTVRWGPGLAALVGAILIQIGTNFANDVFDHEKGADTSERVGPTRAVQAGWLSAAAMRRGMYVVFGLAIVVGLYLSTVVGPWVLVLGAASIASGVAYTGGPYPLAYNGLGDLFVFVFFGFVAVAGTTWVELGYVPALAWLAAVPVGALSTAILVVNNVRDHVQDARADKRTLIVRFGRRFGLVEYAFMLVLAFAAPIVAVTLDLAGPAVLLAVAPAPIAFALWVALVRRTGSALNPVLVGTAQLLLAYGALLAIGLVLAGD